MQINEMLIDNIGEEEIKKYVKNKKIRSEVKGQDFQHWISDLVGTEISKEEFEDFCLQALMYGKRKLIRVYEIGNARKLKDEDKWLKTLKKEFYIGTLNFNHILTTNLEKGDEWKIAAVSSLDDEKGDLERICILLQCYICMKGNKDACAYIPVEIDLKSKLLLVRAWRRQFIENAEEYKYNFLMNRIVKWLMDHMEIETKKVQLNYKKILSDMNTSLIDELLDAIPISREVRLLKEYYAKVSSHILNTIHFENKCREDNKDVLPEKIINIENELENLVTRAIVSDFFFKRDYSYVWKMKLSAIVNSVKFTELDDSITIVKSENGRNPVFCGKPFLMLLSAMEDSKKVDSLTISFENRNKKFRVNYDAKAQDYIEIGVLSGQEDFCFSDYETIWEMLKKYENGKILPVKTDAKMAIGE